MKIESKIGKESSITFAGLLYGNINRYVYTAMLARWVGPEFLGIYSLANAIVLLSEVIAKMGIETGVVRYIGMLSLEDDYEKIKDIILSAFKMVFIFSISIMLISLLLSDYIALTIFNGSILLKQAIIIFSLTIPFNCLTLISAHATQGFKLLKYKTFVTQFIKPTVLFASAFFVIHFFSKDLTILVPMVATSLVGFLCMSYFLNKIIQIKPTTYLKGSFNYDLLKFSSPLMFVSILQTLMHWMDILMIGYFIDAEAVGYYQPAVRTAGLLQAILLSFLSIYTPMISQFFKEQNFEKMSKIYKMVTRWLILSSLPIAIIFLIFTENLMALFGSQYIASSNILAILTIATFFQAVFGVAAPTLSMTGHTKLVLYNTLSVFIINLLLNSFLIPMMGPKGAAFSTLISLILIGIVRVIQVQYILKINFFSIKLIKPFIAAGITTSLLLIVKSYIVNFNELLTLLLATLLCLGSYLILMWVFRLENEDREFLKGLKIIRKNLFND